MEQLLNDLLSVTLDNWYITSAILYEILSRIIPTSWNVSIIDNVVKLVGLMIKNRRRPCDDDVVDFKDSSINKVIVERDRHIISSLLLLMLLPLSAFAQNPLNATALRLVNVNDSTTITSNAATTNPANFTMFYNKQQSKPRMYFNGIGHDIGTGNGNVTGSFTSGQVPFATGAHALTSNNTLLWNNTSKTLGLFNSGLTLNTSITPSGISHTGGLFSIGNAAGSDITLSTLTTGQINLSTANNSLTMLSTASQGGIVSNRWTTVGTAGDQLLIDATNVNGGLTFTSVGGAGTMQITTNNGMRLRSTGTAKTLDVEFDGSIGVASGTNVIVAADNDVNLTADQDVQVNSGAGISLFAAGDNATLSSAADAQVTGQTVHILANDLIQIQATLGNVDIATTQPLTDVTLTSAANIPIAADGAVSLTFGPGGLGSLVMDELGGMTASLSNTLNLETQSDWGLRKNSGATQQIVSVANDIVAQTQSTGNIELRAIGTGAVKVRNGLVGPYAAHYGCIEAKTLDFGNTASLGETTLTTTLACQANGAACLVTAPSTVGVFTCNIAAGTVNVVFHNTTGSAVDPASGSYVVTILR